MPKAKDSFTEPDYKEAENPQAHKYTHDPDTKKCIHCGYGLSMHRDNGTGMVRGNKFTAYDSELKPIPVNDEELKPIKMAWNTSSKGATYSDVNRPFGGLELRIIDCVRANWLLSTYNAAKPFVVFGAGKRSEGAFATLAEAKSFVERVAAKEIPRLQSKYAKDSELKPIPVNDFTPRGGLKCAKCGTSVGQVNRTVSGRALCGRCKAISEAAKDDLKPIPIKDSFNGLVGKLERGGKSKEYATKIAGKVAAEKKAKDRRAKDASCPLDKIPHLYVYDDDADDGSCADCNKKKNDPVHTTYKGPGTAGYMTKKAKDREPSQDEERAFEMGEADAKRGLPNPNPSWPQTLKAAYKEGYRMGKRSAKAQDARPPADCCYFVTT